MTDLNNNPQSTSLLEKYAQTQQTKPGKLNILTACVYNVSILYLLLKTQGTYIGKKIKKNKLRYVPYRTTYLKSLLYLSLPLIILVPNIFLLFGPSFVRKFKERREIETQIIEQGLDVDSFVNDIREMVITSLKDVDQPDKK